MNLDIKKRPFKGLLDELTNRFGREFGARLRKLEDYNAEAIKQTLSSLSKDELQELRKLIEERRERVDVSPAYENEVVGISKGILSFGVAGLALVAALSESIVELPPLLLNATVLILLFYIDLVLVSLLTLLIFLWQSRFRYPFLYFEKIGNTIPFFYYKATSSITPREVFQSAERKYLASFLYGRDLRLFAVHLKKSVSFSGDDMGKKSLERIVRDEIQQYFLLLQYQGYVNQSEVRLTNFFLYGMAVSALSSIFAFFIASTIDII